MSTPLPLAVGINLLQIESISGLIVRNSGNFIGLAACLPKARPDSSSDTVVAIFHSILTS